MLVNTEIADKYQDLFNLMSKEHGLTLTIEEMDEIISEAMKVVKNISSNQSVMKPLPSDLDEWLKANGWRKTTQYSRFDGHDGDGGGNWTYKTIDELESDYKSEKRMEQRFGKKRGNVS